MPSVNAHLDEPTEARGVVPACGLHVAVQDGGVR